MRRADALAELERVCARVPGAARYLVEVARELEAGADEYERSHWGDRGRAGPSTAVVPDATGGIVLLGELVAITYRARKGRRSTIDDWEHPFDPPLPRLCYARDGSGLVIARGRSKYRVEARGIVG